MSAIASSFNDKSEPKAVISNGVKINGEKYMTIESTDDSLKAKKVRLRLRDTGYPDRRLTNNRARLASSPTRLHKRCSSPTTPTPSKRPTPTTRSSSWANTSRRSATKHLLFDMFVLYGFA